MNAFAKTSIDPALLSQQAQANRASTSAARLATGDPQKAEHAAEEFEAMFLAQMLQPMFAGIETDGYFGGGAGENVYRSMLIEQYGKAMAKAGGVGIADQVKAAILKLQEVE